MPIGTSLSGQVAVITGASRGIGFAIADALARNGAHLVLLATNADRLREAREQLQRHAVSVETMVVDIRFEEQCHASVEAVIERFGQVDILVNSAAIYKVAPFLDHSKELFADIFDVNMYGTVYMMQAVLPSMLARKYGRIINISSAAGKWAHLNQTAYSMSKHAVIGLTRCAALEYARTGITVNAICPGMVQTEMADQLLEERSRLSALPAEDIRAQLIDRIPVGRFIDPDEIAALATYLASADAGGITGQSIMIDGGVHYI